MVGKWNNKFSYFPYSADNTILAWFGLFSLAFSFYVHKFGAIGASPVTLKRDWSHSLAMVTFL